MSPTLSDVFDAFSIQSRSQRQTWDGFCSLQSSAEQTSAHTESGRKWADVGGEKREYLTVFQILLRWVSAFIITTSMSFPLQMNGHLRSWRQPFTGTALDLHLVCAKTCSQPIRTRSRGCRRKHKTNQHPVRPKGGGFSRETRRQSCASSCVTLCGYVRYPHITN